MKAKWTFLLFSAVFVLACSPKQAVKPGLQLSELVFSDTSHSGVIDLNYPLDFRYDSVAMRRYYLSDGIVWDQQLTTYDSSCVRLLSDSSFSYQLFTGYGSNSPAVPKIIPTQTNTIWENGRTLAGPLFWRPSRKQWITEVYEVKGNYHTVYRSSWSCCDHFAHAYSHMELSSTSYFSLNQGLLCTWGSWHPRSIEVLEALPDQQVNKELIAAIMLRNGFTQIREAYQAADQVVTRISAN